jgi:pimeloyl-ACP methyl ester carboxylesterase
VRRRCLTVVALGALLLLPGCGFRTLKRDIMRLEGLALLGGHVSRTPEDGTPIVMGLVDVASSRQVDCFVLDRSGSYFFMVAPGTYRIAAFVDVDRNTVHSPKTEPAATYGTPTDVPIGHGQKIGDLDVAIVPTSRGVLDPTITAWEEGRRASRELPPIHVGDLTTIDDPRFTAENGHLGLWAPVEFLFTVGAGFYFLEPYDSSKTPVLFVHGAGGNPSEFRTLVEHLDRKKFQPWLAFYPSGLDVATIARGAVRWLDVLAVRHRFERIVIVAHSMGGLVSREVIDTMIEQGAGERLAGFITLSTPWNGHHGAQLGVEQAPVVMPMWRDVAPGSAFLAKLHRKPLPAACPHSLLFSYVGHSLVMPSRTTASSRSRASSRGRCSRQRVACMASRRVTRASSGAHRSRRP